MDFYMGTEPIYVEEKIVDEVDGNGQQSINSS